MKIFLGLMIVLTVAGCTRMPKPEGMPAPDMTFEHMRPLNVNVGEVKVLRTYEPGKAANDASARFVVSPSEAAQRYAAVRLKGQPSFYGGRLDFTVTDALVEHRTIEQKSEVVKFTGLGREDEYVVHLVVDLAHVRQDGSKGFESTLKFRRTLRMSESVSLAEREMLQIKFLETLINDLDKAVVESLKGTMKLLD